MVSATKTGPIRERERERERHREREREKRERERYQTIGDGRNFVCHLCVA